MDIVELNRFLTEIARNNNREWLAANDDRYRKLRREWLDVLGRMIDAMTLWEPRFAALSPRESTYRFARDTRFSPDKSPYKTFFSAAFAPYGRKSMHAGYYIQVGPGDDTGLWGGIYCPDAATLRKLRHAIVDNIEEFRAITDDPGLLEVYGPAWVGDALKTAPKGWPKDHAEIELLRLKDYGKFHSLDDAFFSEPDWPERAAAMMRPLKPLVDFLNYSIDE